jgi:hypothetical protein
MTRTRSNDRHLVAAIASPFIAVLLFIQGGVVLFALIGIVGTLFSAFALHILSPGASVIPLLRIAGLAAMGPVAVVVICAVLVALLRRR